MRLLPPRIFTEEELLPPFSNLAQETGAHVMETIIKVISFFIALFVIANGIWVAFMPPFGDEPVGYAIIAVGIFIPLITLHVAKLGESPYD
jgi:ABC-type uncharacterized transport system permease subunit